MKKTLIEPTEYIKNLVVHHANYDIIRLLKFQKDLDLQFKHELIGKLFNQRTAEEIIKDGFTTGCTDDAIVFIALAKAVGLNPIYMETLEKKWVEAPMEERMVKGHVFVKINDSLIDPQRKVIYVDPEWVLSNYIVYAKGKEPYDFGLTDHLNIIQKFMDFKEQYKKSH